MRFVIGITELDMPSSESVMTLWWTLVKLHVLWKPLQLVLLTPYP